MTRMNIRCILPGIFCRIVLSASALADSLFRRNDEFYRPHTGAGLPPLFLLRAGENPHRVILTKVRIQANQGII